MIQRLVQLLAISAVLCASAATATASGTKVTLTGEEAIEVLAGFMAAIV